MWFKLFEIGSVGGNGEENHLQITGFVVCFVSLSKSEISPKWILCVSLTLSLSLLLFSSFILRIWEMYMHQTTRLKLISHFLSFMVKLLLPLREIPLYYSIFYWFFFLFFSMFYPYSPCYIRCLCTSQNITTRNKSHKFRLFIAHCCLMCTYWYMCECFIP